MRARHQMRGQTRSAGKHGAGRRAARSVPGGATACTAKSRALGLVRTMACLRCLAVPPGTGASRRCAGNGAAAGAVRVSDGELGPRAGSRQRPAVPDPGLEHVLRDSEL